jgi:transcriptional regulator with XRE-family HTH domain
MPSFQITIKPSKRAAGRFVYGVRRAIQKVLAEEQTKRGLTQTAIADAIGVHRSVINREIRGKKDITIGRVAELAWAMGRKAVIDFPTVTQQAGSNAAPIQVPQPLPRAAATSAKSPNEITDLLNEAMKGAAAPVPVA